MKKLSLFLMFAGYLLIFAACSEQAPPISHKPAAQEKAKTTEPVLENKEEATPKEKPDPKSTNMRKLCSEVDILGKDGIKRAYISAKDALREVKPGETVLLGFGMHRGPLLLKTKGVILKGTPGAFVNGNDGKWKPEWTKEPNFGAYAYSSPIPFEPINISINDRVMILADEKRGGWNIHQHGIGRNDRTPLQGVFSYIKKQKLVLISFARDIDPNKENIEAAARTSNAITVDGADNCIVENLIVTGGNAGIRLTNTKGTIVKNCLVFSVNQGISIYEKAESCKVISCDVTWNSDAMNYDCDKKTGLPGNDVWNAHKHHGSYDKWGIFIDRAGKNNEVAYNYVYETWNGIQAGDGITKEKVKEVYENRILKGKAKYNIGLKIHHNRIDLTMNDALEPTGELVDNQWYSNLVTRAHCGLRIKNISLGPFFIFDNMVLNCDNGMRFHKSTPKNATVYIYHNYFQIERGISYHNIQSVCWDDPWLRSKIKKGTPGFHVFNNIFVSDRPFTNASTEEIKPNFKADHNLYTCPPDNMMRYINKIDINSTFEAEPKFKDAANANWLLQPGSPGKAQGMDLTKFKVNLPFCDKKYFKENKPDVGLIGIELKKIPRGPVSGLWETAAKQLNIGEKNDADFELSPFRWVSGSKLDFTLKDLPRRKSIDIVLMRSAGKDSKYKLKVTDMSGKLLGIGKGSDPYVKIIKIKVPLKGEKVKNVYRGIKVRAMACCSGPN